MLAIPVPFVVSLLLGLLAITLYARLQQQATGASLFLGLCAVTTAVVGLRWTLELKLFSLLQPILAAFIPLAAWYFFASASREQSHLSVKHWIMPGYVTFSTLSQPWLALPIDEALTLMYVVYGVALLRIYRQDNVLMNVSLEHWEGVRKAALFAGAMLVFSAAVDSLISLDFMFNQGKLSVYILTTAHVILLPVLSVAVVIVGINTPIHDQHDEPKPAAIEEEPATTIAMTERRAQEITALLDARIRQDNLYLDPELTLSRLSRKLGIPAKQISIAVNQVHQLNISRLINGYRIEHAKRALVTTQDTVTQISMNCGFQTKSNFNREFSRLTGMTPSEYRQQEQAEASS
ncbi:helix-turn-helix domain-containing protein [Pokkaliibacter sp. CJK22405]|uniref:helix-turn-helix domain-containing protein n=1 Tax=Pokkaliibacter sp. CJK22405 TaxID=3384615 RepID=UPI0039851EF0